MVALGSYGGVVLLSTIWGTFFVVNHDAVKHFPPITLTALRCWLGVAVAGLLTCCCVGSLHLSRDFGNLNTHTQILLVAVFNNVLPFLLQSFATQHISAGMVTIFMSTAPLWVVFFAQRGKVETTSRRRVMGLFLGMCGMVCLTLEPLLSSGTTLASSFVDLLYFGLTLVAAACHAGATVYARSYVATLNPLVVGLLQMLYAAVLLTVAALLTDFESPPHGYAPHFAFLGSVSSTAVLELLYIGVVATGLAYPLFFFLLNAVGAVRLSIHHYLIPVIGVVESVMFQGEWAGKTVLHVLMEVVGMGLILLGSVFVEHHSEHDAHMAHGYTPIGAPGNSAIGKMMVESHMDSLWMDEDDDEDDEDDEVVMQVGKKW